MNIVFHVECWLFVRYFEFKTNPGTSSNSSSITDDLKAAYFDPQCLIHQESCRVVESNMTCMHLQKQEQKHSLLHTILRELLENKATALQLLFQEGGEAAVDLKCGLELL